MPLTCPKYGDASLWGDGDLWCGVSGSYQYISTFGQNERAALTTWNLQSPNTNVWTPSISTSGVLSFSDGIGTATEIPVLPEADDGTWEPSISNAGLVTLTSGTDADAKVASLIDSNSIQWWWAVPAGAGISTLTDRPIVASRVKTNRFAIEVVYDDGDKLIIDRVSSLVNFGPQKPDRYVAYTDFVTHKRVSVQVVFSGGALFVVEYVEVMANVKKHQPKG